MLSLSCCRGFGGTRELSENATARNQFSIGTALDEPAIIENQDAIGL